MTIIRFKCLSEQTVSETQLSDHDPIVYGDFCSFNLLCQCVTHPNFQNNAFGRIENKRVYTDRLLNLISVIQELHNSGIRAFAFQEAPDPNSIPGQAFYENLKKAIPSLNIDTKEFVKRTEGTRSYTFFAFDSDVYPIQIDITNKHSQFVSESNKKRFQAAEITNKMRISIVMYNFHAAYNKQSETVLDIKHAICSGAIVAGDLNLSKDFLGNQFNDVPQCVEKANLFNSVDVIFNGFLYVKLKTNPPIIFMNKKGANREKLTDIKISAFNVDAPEFIPRHEQVEDQNPTSVYINGLLPTISTEDIETFDAEKAEFLERTPTHRISLANNSHGMFRHSSPPVSLKPPTQKGKEKVDSDDEDEVSFNGYTS